MNRFFMYICTMIMLLTVILPASAHADIDLSKLVISSAPVANSQQLSSSSALVAYGWFDSADQEVHTSKKVSGKQIVNFVQTFHVKESLKGQSDQLIRVVSTGVEPLPDADDPLNKTHPGPLAEGNYICFFKKIPNSDLYQIVGGWQGVYPYMDGKSISLQDGGFTDYNGLSLAQFKQRIQQTGQHR